jgi:outer membrane lipoprotein-sorting protein
MKHIQSRIFNRSFYGICIIAALMCLAWADTWHGLKETAATVTSVTAEFVQEKHMKILARPLVSRGVLLYKTPDSLRWEYTQPVKSVLVLHKGQIRRFVNKDGRVVEDSATGLQSMQVVVQQITQWLNGRFDENPAFSATLEPGPRIVMTPREKSLARLIQRIELELSDQPAVIESVTIFESEDSYTRLVFQNVTLNTQLDDAAFSVFK